MCYVIPTVAAALTTCMWQKTRSPRIGWLSLLFLGGALFGIIDHIWNGELFSISKPWVKDLSLGIVISAAIILTWGMICLKDLQVQA